MENQADYLMIVPEELIDGLASLVAHRTSQGLSVAVVTVERIEATFPDPTTREERILELIAYASEHWRSPRFQYVLLAGDTDRIPTHYFASSLTAFGELEVAIDDLYATLPGDDDEFPDLALGRFPASTRAELDAMVAKTLAFEAGQGVYGTDALILADYRESNPLGLAFETQADEFAARMPDDVVAQRMDLRPESSASGTRQDLLDQLALGVRILSFVGFGSPALWSESGVFTLDDPSTLTGDPSLVVVHTASQDFDQSAAPTLIRNLILSKSSGSVASVASSGISSSAAGYAFLATFWESLWGAEPPILGKAVLAAKRAQDAGRDGNYQTQASRFTLLGDPALRIP